MPFNKNITVVRTIRDIINTGGEKDIDLFKTISILCEVIEDQEERLVSIEEKLKLKANKSGVLGPNKKRRKLS